MQRNNDSAPKVTENDGTAEGTRATWIGAAANAFLIVVKFVAGIFGNSAAMVADAVHSLSDFITDAVALLGLWLGRRPPDEAHHFGHGRMETLATGLVGAVLIGAAVYMGIGAVESIGTDTTRPQPELLALFGAAISIAVKEVLYRYTIRVGRRIRSPVVIANAWHHRSDALSSIAVLFGVAAAIIDSDWAVMDAYAALVVCFMIGKVGLQISWQTLLEMVDTAPDPAVQKEIRERATGVLGVLDVHDLKIRTVGGIHLVQLDIVVDGEMSVREGHTIAAEVHNDIRDGVDGIGEVVVHVDPSEPPVSDA